MKQKIISIIFIFIVFFFFIAGLVTEDKDFSYNENRELAQLPVLKKA